MIRRLLTEEERDLWHAAVQEGAGAIPVPSQEKPPVMPYRKAGAGTVPRRIREHGSDFASVDRHLRRQLRNGRIEIERRVDLHGLKEIDAHDRLRRFIVMARADGARCVLVITGKGSGNRGLGTGILRRMTPRWLKEEPLRREVSGVCHPALPVHGGEGAFYVFLRRNVRTRPGVLEAVRQEY